MEKVATDPDDFLAVEHCSVDVNAVEDGADVLDRYRDRLGRVKAGSASIAIPSLDRLDVGALTELLRRAHELRPG